MKNVYIITQKDMWDVINDLCNEDEEKQQEKTMKKLLKLAKYGCTFRELSNNEQYIIDVIEDYYKQDKVFQVKLFNALIYQMKNGQKATVMKTIQILRG